MNQELFSVGSAIITPQSLILIAVILIGSYLTSRIVQGILKKVLSSTKDSAPGLVASSRRLVHYVIMVTGTFIALEVIGFELQTLFAAGAILAIGIGFAMQNLTQNFVSGVILLTERSIKPGDILEVEGTVVRVTRMGLRSTIARTREETELIIPNSTLVQTTVKNYTFRDTAFRIRVLVGISYHSDVPAAMKIMKDAVDQVEWRTKQFNPVVMLSDFGDSSVVLEASVWIEDAWQARFYYSDLRVLLWNTFKEHDITIAFPQLDVHFDNAPPFSGSN